ncbi:MAG: hypothetical protein HOP11_05605 [Saprospiraceae bacterium]|nr:hypothetical protein [Saprospiraceae bacterium]
MKNLMLFSSILSILFLTCCDKNSSGMEPCNNCHTNIFQCKINGVDWKPDCIPDPLFGCNSIETQYYLHTNWLGINCINDFNKISFALYSENIKYLDSISLIDVTMANLSKNKDCIIYKIDSSQFSYLKIIEINETKRIIEGSFACSLINKCETLRISDGYFKLKF